MMRHVVSDFLLKRIAWLQERSREACSYSGMLDRTRFQPGPAGELPQSMYSLLMRQLTGVEAPLPPLQVLLLSSDPSREEIISRMPACDKWGILDSWPSPPVDIPGDLAPLMVAPVSLMDADGGSREAEAMAFPANRDSWEM